MRLVTSTPTGVTRRGRVDGMEVRYVRTPVPPRLRARGFTHETAFAAVAAAATLVTGAELVHAWLYGDGYGAAQALRVRRRPLVLKLTGNVLPERIGDLPVDERMLRSVLGRADEVWCNSVFARDSMAGFGVPMRIVPAGVDLARFTVGAERAPGPVVFVASALDDPRKRLVDLLDAWPQVLEGRPDATLRIAGRAEPATEARLRDRLPAATVGSVTFLAGLDDEALVAEYQRAWVTVAPAVHEALGLTTIESLACGTPVAGADSGATPELVTEGTTGALFAPADPEDCARALLRALALAERPDIRDTCRAAAQPFGWEGITDQVVARYRELTGAV